MLGGCLQETKEPGEPLVSGNTVRSRCGPSGEQGPWAALARKCNPRVCSTGPHFPSYTGGHGGRLRTSCAIFLVPLLTGFGGLCVFRWVGIRGFSGKVLGMSPWRLGILGVTVVLACHRYSSWCLLCRRCDVEDQRGWVCEAADLGPVITVPLTDTPGQGEKRR